MIQTKNNFITFISRYSILKRKKIKTMTKGCFDNLSQKVSKLTLILGLNDSNIQKRTLALYI